MTQKKTPLFQISGRKKELLSPPETPNFLLEERPGGFLIATDPETGTRHRFFVRQNRGELSAQINGWTYRGAVLEPQYGSTASNTGSAELEAQFPGKISKVHVHPGQKVNAGDPLVVLVAMKMEFVIQAPQSGTVRSVLVQEGSQVNTGQRFVEIQPDPEVQPDPEEK